MTLPYRVVVWRWWMAWACCGPVSCFSVSTYNDIDLGSSVMQVSPEQAVAAGVDGVNVTVWARRADGNPVADLPLTFACPFCSIGVPPQPTNAQGEVTVTIRSTYLGPRTITAMLTSPNFSWSIPHPVAVNFVAPTALVGTPAPLRATLLAPNSLTCYRGMVHITSSDQPTSTTCVGAVGAAALADVNNDGHLDAVVPDLTYGTISIFLGDGSGALHLAATLNGFNEPVVATLADLNNDGWLDCLVVDQQLELAVVHGDGMGGFTEAPTLWPTLPSSFWATAGLAHRCILWEAPMPAPLGSVMSTTTGRPIL